MNTVVAPGASAGLVPLSEVASIQSGITKGRPRAEQTEELPYIRTANVQAMRLDLDEVKTIAATGPQAARHRLQPGDVLILEGGDADKVGRGWIWESQIEDCLHQNHVFAVRTDRSRLLSRLLAYFVNAPQARAYFLSCAKQTTNLASINKRNLSELAVPAPSLREQERIIAVLDRQMADVAAARKHFAIAVARLADFRAAVLHGAIDLEPQGSPTSLGDFSVVTSGVTKGRKTKDPVTPHAFLRAANLKDGALNLDEIKAIDVTAREAAKYQLEDGDLLMVEGSGSPARLGQGWLWEGQVEKCLHQNHVFRARPDQSVVLPRYLAWCLQAPSARSYFRSVAKTTSGLATINKRQVCAWQVPVPSLARQGEIVSRVERDIGAADTFMRLMDKQRETIADLERSILHAAWQAALHASPSEALARNRNRAVLVEA
jgi:type I restriction enzyme S subunit